MYDVIDCMFHYAAAASAGSPSHSCLVATQQQICSPDPDLADPPTPLAACAGRAAQGSELKRETTVIHNWTEGEDIVAH
jgi:hypothetical protein